MNNKMMWTYFLELSGHIMGNIDKQSRLWYPRYPQKGYAEGINCDEKVWDEAVSFLKEKKFNACVIDLGDGVKYESYPEIAAPDAWDRELLKKKLAEMREAGIEPLPKLNFSMTHSAWMKQYRRYASTPEYYKFCSALIAEVCELFDKPRLFHLGMDEELEGMQPNYDLCIVRQSELWWHDLCFLLQECEKHGARPWIWADYFWNHPEEFAEKMPRSVLLSNWTYGVLKSYSETNYHKARTEAFEKLDKLGFEQVPAGSLWEGVINNPYELMRHGKEKLSAERVLGYMMIPWVSEISEDTIYTIKNNAHAFQVARMEVYPEKS